MERSRGPPREFLARTSHDEPREDLRPASAVKETVRVADNAHSVNGTGSLVLTDDLEIYNRIGLGFQSAGSEWLQIGRGYQGDVPDEHGGRRGKNSTSEVYIRNMFDAWLDFMADEHPVGDGRLRVSTHAAEIRP